MKELKSVLKRSGRSDLSEQIDPEEDSWRWAKGGAGLGYGAGNMYGTLKAIKNMEPLLMAGSLKPSEAFLKSVGGGVKGGLEGLLLGTLLGGAGDLLREEFK